MTLFKLPLLAVLLSLCACGVPLPEEEEVASSQEALSIERPPPKEDPCITECRTIVDSFRRDNCIRQCILKNIR